MTEIIPLLLKNWKLAIGALALAVLALLLTLAKADARHFSKLYEQEEAAHAQTVADYRVAADEATHLDAANVARVKTEQTAITERTIDAYQSQLADSASRYERLRVQASDYLSRPVTTDLSASRETTCRAVAGTGCTELPALLKAAQDNTDQLITLQAWAASQAGVDVVGVDQ